MDFELHKGLPLKTVMVERNEYENYYGVSTEMVGTLLMFFFENSDDVDLEIEEFDNSVSYFVPQEIFEADENTIINYINENIERII